MGAVGNHGLGSSFGSLLRLHHDARDPERRHRSCSWCVFQYYAGRHHCVVRTAATPAAAACTSHKQYTDTFLRFSSRRPLLHHRLHAYVVSCYDDHDGRCMLTLFLCSALPLCCGPVSCLLCLPLVALNLHIIIRTPRSCARDIHNVYSNHNDASAKQQLPT